MKWLNQWERLFTRLSEERFYLYLLIFMAAGTAAAVMNLGLDLHRNFLTIACDTAVYQSAVVNTLHGSLLTNDGPHGPSILLAHTTFVLLLVAPIFALFPYTDTLFILQMWGTYSAVIPLYLIARHWLRRPLLAFGVAATALACPIFLHMALAPFHPETWVSAAVFWSYYSYLRRNALGFWLGLLFSVSCGEQAALIYIALGLALLLGNDGIPWRTRFGIYALGGGAGWLLLAVEVILPWARGNEPFNIFAYNYANWGIASAAQLPIAVLHDPIKALVMVLSPARWLRVLELIGLPLLLAILSRRTVFLLLPFPFYFLMTDQEFYLYFHAYYFQFAFFAGSLGLVFLLSRCVESPRVGMAVLSVSAFLNVLLLCPAMGFYDGFDLGVDEDFSSTLRTEFSQIPPDAVVYSPHRYSAYLSNRPSMILADLRDQNMTFDQIMDEQLASTHVRPEQVDFVVSDLINDQCGWRQGGYNADLTQRRAANINQFIQSRDWEVFWKQNDVVILKRVRK